MVNRTLIAYNTIATTVATFNVNVSSNPGRKVIFVGSCEFGGPLSSVVWDSSLAFTLASIGGHTADQWSEIWYLDLPYTVSSGTHQIQATWGGGPTGAAYIVTEVEGLVVGDPVASDGGYTDHTNIVTASATTPHRETYGVSGLSSGQNRSMSVLGSGSKYAESSDSYLSTAASEQNVFSIPGLKTMGWDVSLSTNRLATAMALWNVANDDGAAGMIAANV
jgi:hypothetical protein